MTTTDNTPKLRKVTYLGVPARVGMIKLSNGRSLSETHWDGNAVGQPVEHPAGTVVFKILSGDFRQGTGVVHEQIVLDPAAASGADTVRTLLIGAWS
jgi:hypothetical protein